MDQDPPEFWSPVFSLQKDRHAASLADMESMHNRDPPRSTAIHQPQTSPSLSPLFTTALPSSLSVQGNTQQKGSGAVHLFPVSHLFTRLDKLLFMVFKRRDSWLDLF